ncbi:MAG: isocitrate/isopropylmalate family dehydrogenase, partial [Nitrosotalea sp.]
LGMAPAANIGDRFALFEPVHGAAFDIAGKQIANPSSFILSAKMMFEWLGIKNNDKSCQDVAKKIEDAVYGIVKDGIKTRDIGGNKSTREFTQNVILRIIT